MKLSKEKIIDIFGDINTMFLSSIESVENKATDFIEKELYNDFVETYNRAYRLLKNDKMTDGMVILRSSFELLMILFGTRIDKNVKDEYCREDSYERYRERKRTSKKAKDYLSQSYLREIILKHYHNIESDYSKLYEVLSKYAHPTIHRNESRYLERTKADITIVNLNLATIIPILFIEILYEQEKISKEKYDDISLFRYIIDRLTTLYLVTSVDKRGFVGVKNYLFTDTNAEYNEKEIGKVKKDMINTEELIQQYKNDLKEELTKTLSKVEYNSITKKLLELGL